MLTATPRKIRIFVSSPSDVDEERRRMMEIIAVLNRRYAGVIVLEGVFWEQTVYPAHATFQAQIDEPASCDLVVCVLWSRLGSPLPAGWPTRPDPDGKPYESGTVYEFETALAARRIGEVPDIYVFRKLLPEDRAALDQLMERHPAEKLRILDYLISRGNDDSRAAIELLEGFWSRWFYSPDKGFIAAFNTFTTADHFNELGRQAIEDWLIGKGLVARQPDWDIEQHGSPYPGLAAFDSAHAAVFFGRERVTERALALFRGAAEAGFPWLLLTGPSGGGKSSLLRAGIVPALTEETVLETWRAAVVRPGAEDPLGTLLAAIAGAGVLGPALAEGDYPAAADLARIARLAPGELVRPLLRALDRRGETVRERIGRNTAPFARLLLVIDQMEEILLAPAERQAEFAAVLGALLAGGDSRIWIAATLRSDLQEAFLKIPAFQPLLTLDRGGRELKLAAPGPADMREVIEGPASRAGLSFETREDGKSLAEELVAAVGTAADALPVLQMTLALLFDRRDPEHRLLRWADYTAMGGLDGAIADQAEAVLRGLAPEVTAELGPLIRQLTRLWLSLDGEIELRPAELDETRLSGARAELAAALVAGRLLVADHGKLRIVHEAVLRNWDRARELLSADLDLARLKTRLEPLVAEWLAAGGNPNDAARLLPAGAQLAAADAAARRYPAEEIGEDLARFIAASVEFERRQRTRRQRILAIAAAAFAGLAMLAIAGGIFAWHERGVAAAARDEAEHDYQLALGQAAGSVRAITDNYAAGRISTPLMQALITSAQKTVQGLPNERPEVTAARVQLLDVLSLADLTLGQVAAARGFAEEARDLIDPLPPTTLPGRQWQILWAASRHQLGEVLFWQGDLSGALVQLDAARKIAAELVAAEPDNRVLVKALLADIARTADATRAAGRLPAAIEKYREWLAEVQKRRRQADDADWSYSEADVRQRLGDAYLAKGDPAQAIEQYSTYGAIAAELSARDPADRRYQRSIAWSHERIGDALLAQGALDRAAAEYDTYRDLTRALADQDPTNFLWHQDYEVAYQRVGEVLLRRGDPAGALKQFEIYRAMTAAAKDKDPTNGTAIYDVSNALQKIGDAHRAAGEFDAALDAYRQSLALAEELIGRDRSNTAWQLIVAVGHQRLAVTLAAKGDSKGARGEYRACIDTQISGVPYSPRILWPTDVHQYCRRELEKTPGDNKH